MLSIWYRMNVSMKLLSGFGLVVAMVIVTALFSFKQLDNLTAAARQAAEVDASEASAAMSIQVNMALAHFELHEYLGGDKSFTLAAVLESWRRAQWYADAMLEGGERDGEIYYRVESDSMRDAITRVKDDIKIIISLVAPLGNNTRHDTKHSGTLDEFDQELDIAFYAGLKNAKRLEFLYKANARQSIQNIIAVHAQTRTNLIIALLVVTISCITIPLLIARFVVIKPVNELNEAMSFTSKGDLSRTLVNTGQDEFGKLASAFNIMTNSLKNIVHNVQKTGVQLAASATDMTATVREQEASSRQQEATANQIVASTKEISATSKELANSMDEVARVVDDTASLAQQGHSSLSRMGSTIAQMVVASKDISSKLSILNERAANITSVVTTINKVADQTNLLSVNAAIEADKAGEYGIGFGTVATEIRRLADQTAVATWDIEEMVKEMQSAVSSGVMGMEKFSDQVRRGVDEVQEVGQQLTRIIEQVQTLGPHFENVHEGVYAQSQGAQQISDALGQLGEAIRGTVESLRQSNKVIDALHTESANMREAVSVFKLGTTA